MISIDHIILFSILVIFFYTFEIICKYLSTTESFSLFGDDDDDDEMPEIKIPEIKTPELSDIGLKGFSDKDRSGGDDDGDFWDSDEPIPWGWLIAVFIICAIVVSVWLWRGSKVAKDIATSTSTPTPTKTKNKIPTRMIPTKPPTQTT